MSRIETLLTGWLEDDEFAERAVHIEHEPPRAALYEGLERPLPDVVVRRLNMAGVDEFYRHQAGAIDRVRADTHTVLVAGTASGKSLAYQVPILEAAAHHPEATSLLLFPTKALARDQLRSLNELSHGTHHVAEKGTRTQVDRTQTEGTQGLATLVADAYDGDTDQEDRKRIRDRSTVVLTNPDMVHYGLLPHHARWNRFLSELRFVVVDELHAFRGVFGSHVAQILRRLRRLARSHGSDPTFVFTSATVGNPGDLATRLSGLDVDVVEEDTSPQGARTVVLWNPELKDSERGIRTSPLTDSTRVFVQLVGADLHTIVFARSRKACELMYRWARERLDPSRSHRVATYRGGYLPEDRRRIERALFSGDLLGLTTTNALELGIDVGALDACVLTTFPGTIASFRQQIGRSGRNQDDSLAVLVAGQDALDQFYVTHPEDLFSRSAEAAVVNPLNPKILAAHVACAAHEEPIVPADTEFFGHELEETVTEMVGDGRLGVRDSRLFWAGGGSPARAIDIRTSGGPAYRIYEDSGNQIGTIDEGRAFSQCHPGAVYLHQGEEYLVEHLDRHLHEIRARREDTGYYTEAQVDKDLAISSTTRTRRISRMTIHRGEVEVSSHVLGYRRKEIGGGRVLDDTPLDLPQRIMNTQATWYTFDPDVIEEAGQDWTQLPGTLHAAEHTAIAVLPLFAVCDRWDIGGLSTVLHSQVGEPCFFIYDGHDGGAGISPIAFDTADSHLSATLAVLDECACHAGCPSCVQSPKCGNFNEPLDRWGAGGLLRIALAS